MFLIILYVGLTISFITGKDNDYNKFKGYSVLKILPKNNEQWNEIEAVIHDMQLDIWNEDPDNGIDVLVSAETKQALLQVTTEKAIPVRSTISKVEELLESENRRLHTRTDGQRRQARGVGSNVPFDLEDFNTYESMMSQLDIWKGDCAQDQLKCDTVVIGQTVLGEDIKVFKIKRYNDNMESTEGVIHSTTVPITSGSTGLMNPFTTLASMYFSDSGVSTEDHMETNDNTPDGTSQKDIYITCLMHAREWITGPTCMKIIHKLTTQYGHDPVITDLVNRYNWNIVPVVNPDGYRYTWTTNRFWRKNLQPTTNENCTGIDLNRNFLTRQRCNNTLLYRDNTDYGSIMSSRNPCSHLYCGYNTTDNRTTMAPETTAIQDMILYGDLNVSLVIDIHAYARMWLAPTGTVETVGPPYKCHLSEDHTIHNGVSQLAAGASARAGYFKNIWRGGSICKVIYPVSGSLTDFAYEQAEVKHSYVVEMREGSDNKGFIANQDDIQEGFNEVWEALLEIVRSVDKLDNV